MIDDQIGGGIVDPPDDIGKVCTSSLPGTLLKTNTSYSTALAFTQHGVI
ncbi:hypothetical protein NHJ13734_008422 [Beauveria thailandica]